MGDQRDHQPTTDQIARAAYLLWEREGRPQGQDVAYWLRAERQLMAGAGGAPFTPDPGAQSRTELPQRPVAARRSGPRRPTTAKL